MGDIYFDGDPATDSARRHMERVLKGESAGRRWPLLLAALGSGAVWLLWSSGRDAARNRQQPESQAQPSSAAPRKTS